MCLARAYLIQRKQDHAAASKVQAIWRGSYQCRAYKQFQSANAERIPSAILVQTRFRANRARQKVKLLSESRHRNAEQASAATYALEDVSGRASRRLLVAASYATEGAKWTSPAYRTRKDTFCTCTHVRAQFVLFFVSPPARSRSVYTRCPFKSSCWRCCDYNRHSFSLCARLNLFVWYLSCLPSIRTTAAYGPPSAIEGGKTGSFHGECQAMYSYWCTAVRPAAQVIEILESGTAQFRSITLSCFASCPLPPFFWSQFVHFFAYPIKLRTFLLPSYSRR